MVMSLFPDGTVLTGDNTAEFLLNKVYVDYPVSMQDALFAQVAEQTVGSMFSNVDLTLIMVMPVSNR